MASGLGANFDACQRHYDNLSPEDMPGYDDGEDDMDESCECFNCSSRGQCSPSRMRECNETL